MGNVIGTCGKCGGPVELPSHMVNPVACCKQCGATAKNPHGPVIPMEDGKSFDMAKFRELMLKPLPREF